MGKMFLSFLARLLSAVVLMPIAALAPSEAIAGDDAPALRLTLLGTGTPVASASQFGASTLIEAGGRTMLFDCGRGCAIRLAQARRQILGRIDALFLTHLHSDHVVGLPDFWLGGWTQGRRDRLNIWGPPGTRELFAGLRSAFAFDIHMRGEVERVPASMTGLETEILELSGDGVVFERDGLRVTAFPVDHGAIKPAFGFRIDFGGHAVLLSGDTRATPNLPRYGAGVDVFVLDVMSPAMIRNVRARRTVREAGIIIGHHATAEQAAAIFARTGPRLAVYSHTVNRDEVAAELVAATRAGYQGPLVVAEDLMSIEIGEKIVVRRPGASRPQIFE